MTKTTTELDAICNSLATTIVEKSNKNKPFLVFIGGGRAMGKSTMAAVLQRLVPNSSILSEDYYLFDSKKLESLGVNIEDPRARDYNTFRHHLESLKKNEIIRIPVEGLLASAPGAIYIDPRRTPIIFVEGTGVYSNVYDGLRDFSIFIDSEVSLAEERFVKRCLLNPERNPFQTDLNFPIEYEPKSLAKYFNEYILPFHLEYFSKGAEKADEIVFNERSHYEALVKIEFPNGRTFFMKTPTQEDLTVRKGMVSKTMYNQLFFGGIFSERNIVTFEEYLDRYGKLLNVTKISNEAEGLKLILNRLFDHPEAEAFLLESSKAMPFLWKANPDMRRGFKWADSAIKLAVETLTPDKAVENFQKTAELISDTLKLNSTKGLYVFDHVDLASFSRLIYNSASIVCNKPLTYAMQDDNALMVRNLAYLEACQELGLTELTGNSETLKNLLMVSVYAGIDYPSEETMKAGDEKAAKKEIIRILKAALREKLSIDHFDRMLKIFRVAKTATIVLDDNGESVPDLLLVQNLVHNNPQCKFNFLININQIGINIRADMLEEIINYPEFMVLRQAFDIGQCRILKEDTVSESLSYELLSPEGKGAIDKSDITLVKGQLFFETFNNKSAHTAYIFIPSSSTSIAYSGYARGGVVYVCKKGEKRIVVNDLGVVTKSLLS